MDPWNTFDFITVVGSIVDALMVEFAVSSRNRGPRLVDPYLVSLNGVLPENNDSVNVSNPDWTRYDIK